MIAITILNFTLLMRIKIVSEKWKDRHHTGVYFFQGTLECLLPLHERPSDAHPSAGKWRQ
jgi:hypothetical protein